MSLKSPCEAACIGVAWSHFETFSVMTDKYIEDQGGHRVHYTVNCLNRGPLKPVVLLHGFTENVFVWDSLSRYLCEKGYCVICVDLAGHGKTDSVGSSPKALSIYCSRGER